MRRYPLRGPYALLAHFFTYFGLLVMGVSAVLLAAGGLKLLYTQSSDREFGPLLLVLAVALGVLEAAVVWRHPPTVELAEDGTVTFRWFLRSRSVSVYDITALRWVRPTLWDHCHWDLEPCCVEYDGQTMRLNAVPWVFRRFAEDVRMINPRVEVDVPEA